jgi:hypothetical protein
MANRTAAGRDRRRIDRRFRPGNGAGGWALDPRLLLSASAALKESMAARAGHHPRAIQHPQPAFRPSARLTPTQEIDTQYAQFLSDFRKVEQDYIASLSQTSSSTVAVSATVTAPYTAGFPTIQVDDPAVFGPQGTFSTPIVATALVGSVSVGKFTLTGSSGNLLTINVAQSSNISLDAGTILTANVTVSAANSAGSIFPSFIINRTGLLGINLVTYFNMLPIRLPKDNAPPHTPTQRGAIQTYVYDQAVGSQPTSLQQALLAIPLPATPGADLQIYDAAVAAAVAQSRQQMLDGVQGIFAGTIRISAPAPANRLGVSLNGGMATGSTGTGLTGTSSTSSSTSGTSGG